MQKVLFSDLGMIDYRTAWDYQERLLQNNLSIKAKNRIAEAAEVVVQAGEVLKHHHLNGEAAVDNAGNSRLSTANYLLLLEHTPVYTLGKSGKMENVLITAGEMMEKGMAFFKTNRGGDITFHGPGQVVGYPVIDLENFRTDIGWYLRTLEQVVIDTLKEYNIRSSRSPGETGVWLEPGIKGRERKICAMGVRCSRWVTMHGFAFNVNTDLSYFDNIIPCGIHDKKVTSLQKELGKEIDMQETKEKIKMNFEKVFEVEMVNGEW